MRIRELILQLAFSGDLTTRIAGDEHASVVFDLNQQTRADWIATGKIRLQPSLNRLSEAEHPWGLPPTWLWCRLGEVTTYGATEKAEFSDVKPDTWVLELEDIEKDTSRLTAKIRAKERRFRSSKNRFSNGDVLYGKLRPYLDKVVLADENGVCSTEIIPVTIFAGILPQYLRWFLKSPFFKAYASGSTHGMNLPRMSTEAGRNAVFPLAPLAEQRRIVTKVGELMALCDRLEAQLQERDRLFPVLSRICHTRFAEAPTVGDLNRIFGETNNISPDDLRKSILTLAVKGKLVPQSSRNSSVETTFPGIRLLDHTSSNGVDVPETWGRCNYQSLTTLVTSGSRGWKDYYSPAGAIFLRTQNIKTDKLILDDVAFVRLPKSTEGMRTQVLKDDIMITITGANVTKAARVEEEIPEAYVSQHIALTRPRWPEMSRWLHLCFTSPGSARGNLERLAYGDKPGLNLSNIRDLILPIPPLSEQRLIVAKVDELMALVDNLEAQQQERDRIAAAFAKACVASLTDTSQPERPEKMEAPKTELVSFVTLGKKPKPGTNAPLAKLLVQNRETLPAKFLWQQSGLTIDVFYQQLKTEIAQGWIAPPAEAEMKVLEEV